MAFLLLTGFGYLLPAEADGRSLWRIRQHRIFGFVVRICQLQWELLLLPWSCCWPSNTTQGLQRQRSWHQGGSDQLRTANQGNQTKGREGTVTKRGGKGKKTGKNASLLYEPAWRARVLGGKSDVEEQHSAFVFSPNSHCWNDHFYSQTLSCIVQVFLSCSQVIKQALCCFMHHWNVFICRLNRQLHVFPDLGGEKQSNELSPHEQR